MVDVFCRSLNSLLMHQVDIAQSSLLMRIQFKEFCLNGKLVSSSNSIVARISNITRSIFFEFAFTELEQTNIRSGSLLRIKIRFDFRNGFHKNKIQPEGIGYAFNLLNRGPNRNSP